MKYYRVVAYANLPRSDMVGYFRSYEVYDAKDNSLLCHQPGHSDDIPEQESGIYVFFDRDVIASNPYAAIKKYEKWEHSGKPSSFLVLDED